MAARQTADRQAGWRQRKARSSQWLTGLGLGLLAAGLTLLMWWGGLFVQVRLALDDVLVVPREPSGGVVIIAIDDPSLEQYGRFSEWPRHLYADLIDRLAQGGARVVALDVLLSESSAGDDRLAEAIAAARQSPARTRTVLATVGTQRDAASTDLVGYQAAVGPVTALSAAGALVGSVNVVPDLDGLVRHVPLILRLGEDGQPSLGFGAFLSHRGVSAALLDQVVTRAPGVVTLPGGLAIPVDSVGRMRMRYFSVPGHSTFDVYSFAQVLSGGVDPAVFTDRIVLVGLMEQTALTDSYPVPGSRDGTLMAGVEIHANAVETLLQSAALRTQGRPGQGLTILGLALLGGLVFRLVSWRWFLPALGGLLLAWVSLVLFMFNLRGLVVSLFFSGLALLLAALVVGVYRVVEEVFRRQRTEILLASALGAFEQNFSLAGILNGITDDLDRILGSTGSRGWLWDGPRGELRLAQPALPRGETLPPELRPWHDLALEALNTGQIVTRQRRVAVLLLWHDTCVGVLTGQARWRLGLLRGDLLRRFGWQTAEMIVNARLYEETQRLSDFKTRMIRMASHDLKNPLTRIMGYAELLQAKVEDDGVDGLMVKSLEHIVQASEEINGIILDLLDLEHARRGLDSPEAFDLLQVLDDVIMRAENDMQRKGQAFSVEMPETLPHLTGNAAQLRQAFGNLLGNASKYTPHDGRIWLRVRDLGGRVHVEIGDTGYGIPAEEIPHLFQEFYRIKTDETRDISGTGLGLSLVKAVVEAHGGEVWAESTYGAGSTFTVELPIFHPDDRPTHAPEPGAPAG